MENYIETTAWLNKYSRRMQEIKEKGISVEINT